MGVAGDMSYFQRTGYFFSCILFQLNLPSRRKLSNHSSQP